MTSHQSATELGSICCCNNPANSSTTSQIKDCFVMYVLLGVGRVAHEVAQKVAGIPHHSTHIGLLGGLWRWRICRVGLVPRLQQN